MTKPLAKNMTVTPHQLATVLVFESHIAQLQVGANQLGGFLKLTSEADTLLEAAQLIAKRRDELQREWASEIKVVSALSPSLISP